ncbi:MAG: hypothetical protein U0234_21500 [Sandaracinus sp.]
MATPTGRIETDMTRWPIVVHRTIGSPTDAQVDAFVARSQEILERGIPHVVVFDNLLAEIPSAYMRQKSVDWLKSNGERMKDTCLGTALLFRSPSLRFVMSGVMLFASHPTPHAVCGTLDEALAWSRQQLATHKKTGT